MKKMDWNRVGRTMVNFAKAMATGTIVLKLDRFLPHILVTVVLFALCIFANLKIDQTMVQREKGRVELERARIWHAQKVCELASLRQVNSIEAMLEREGVDVRMPDKPATVIRTR